MYILKKFDVKEAENVKARMVVDVRIMQVSIFHPRPLLPCGVSHGDMWKLVHLSCNQSKKSGDPGSRLIRHKVGGWPWTSTCPSVKWKEWAGQSKLLSNSNSSRAQNEFTPLYIFRRYVSEHGRSVERFLVRVNELSTECKSGHFK